MFCWELFRPPSHVLPCSPVTCTAPRQSHRCSCQEMIINTVVGDFYLSIVPVASFPSGIYFFFLILLPIAPVGFRETLDGWPLPVSSAGHIFFK